VHTPRYCGDVERLYRKVKKYRIITQNYREQNYLLPERDRIKINYGCRSKIDAERYYSTQLDRFEGDLFKLREYSKREVLGVTFVSFKD
jgi:hypothetical protein